MEISAVSRRTDTQSECHLRSLWDNDYFLFCIISSSDRIEDLTMLEFEFIVNGDTFRWNSNKQTLLFMCPEAKSCQLLEWRFFSSLSCWSDVTNWTLLRAHPCICQNKWSFIWVVRFVRFFVERGLPHEYVENPMMSLAPPLCKQCPDLSPSSSSSSLLDKVKTVQSCFAL